jgi:acetate kinase
VFDTAFHAEMPEHAYRYAIPHELAVKHGIRRYGFHGLAYRSVLARYAELVGTPIDRATLVALHLGNGCSAAAIKGGRSVDTSMGLTPLEGLVMGTRSGDVDPALVGHLARTEQVPVEQVERWLNERAGLLGLSGRSQDMRDLLAREREDPRARLAVDVFCYRARKYLGAYLAVLGGADAVVFSGGIGEHAPEVRARICAGMDWIGLALDPARNAAARDGEGRLSPDGARLPVFVIPADEERVIAQDTMDWLTRTGRAR